MAVALRLYRLGKKNNPAYRIVAIDKRDKRNGSYIEVVGFYDPMTKPHKLEFKQERFDYWLSRGALVSEGLRKILHTYKPPKKD